MDFTGCGNTLNMRSPRVLQLIMDSLRYWVHGDARRRLPLRPGEHAGPRAVRGRQARRVLRHHPPGPGPVAGEADRRAVGRRARRLPGRQLPGAVDRVERQVPRRGAPLLEGRRRHGCRSSRRGWPAAATCTSRAAAGRTPASTSSPATTASRCAISSATTTSTTRPTARTTATARTTTSAGTAAPRGRPTTRRIIELRERQKRNFIATLLLSQGVPMLCGGDELGRTQQRQQQRLLPGQRAHLARLGR